MSFDAWVSGAGFAHGHAGAGEGAPTGHSADKPAAHGGPVSTGSELWSYEVAGGSTPGVSWREAHEAGAWVLVGTNAAVGAWCLGAHMEERLRRPQLWWAVIAAQVWIFVEVAFGVVLMNVEDLEPADLPERHVLYGASAIIATAILYGYRSTSPWVKEREHLVYGGGSLFIMGLGLMEVFAL